MEIYENSELGYDEFFEQNRQKLKLGGFSIARVIAQHKGLYKVKNSDGEFLAKVTGKKIFTATKSEDYPAVGDWLAIKELGDEKASIIDMLPRRTIIKRNNKNRDGAQIIATNIDQAYIIESVERDFNLNRFERYLAIAGDGGVNSVIVLNKIDLISKDDLNLILTKIKNRFKNIEVIQTSAKDEIGLHELQINILKGKTYCFLGSSGVGKSSLINKLLGENAIETNDISFQSSRGKHTTTSREIYFLKNGGIVIDNPGMREVGMADASAGVDNLYADITKLAENCRFSDCSHTSEPGCQVLEAISCGKIDKAQYSNYLGLKKETKFYEMTVAEKRIRDYKRGKFIKKAKKEIERFKDN